MEMFARFEKMFWFWKGKCFSSRGKFFMLLCFLKQANYWKWKLDVFENMEKWEKIAFYDEKEKKKFFFWRKTLIKSKENF